MNHTLVTRSLILIATAFLGLGCTGANGNGNGNGLGNNAVAEACNDYVEAAMECYSAAGDTQQAEAYENGNYCVGNETGAAYYDCLAAVFDSTDCSTEEGRESLDEELGACVGN